MNLTPEQKELGRRNFMRALAGTPAVAALGAAAVLEGPVRGGPVRVGFVGLGGEGRVLLEQTDARHAEVVALCDINPTQLKRSDEVLAKAGKPAARHYADWKEMLEKEKLEAVVIATPLWTHADVTVGALETGHHVLCEKMMAWDVASCERMADAARRTGRILEIGHQRFYNPMYQAAYEGIVKEGRLGDVFHARLAWHRNGDWRRTDDLPAPDYSPAPWGYPDFEHLVNWRLYGKYSRGLIAELASHQVAITDWFFGGTPEAAIGSGGIYRYKDGREAWDHVYLVFEYAQGRTATFSSIQSNAQDHYYEAFYGTRATLIFSGESEAYLFEEGGGQKATGVEVAAKGAGPVSAASESRAADAAGRSAAGSAAAGARVNAYGLEVSGFCASIRTGVPLKCGPLRALGSARACLAAWDAVDKKTRVVLPALA